MRLGDAEYLSGFGDCDASRRALRLLAAPHTVDELAAQEASLNAPYSVTNASPKLSARLMACAAAGVVAIVVPDMSLGAIGVPFAQFEMKEHVAPEVVQPWTPTAVPAAEPSMVPVAPFISANLNGLMQFSDTAETAAVGQFPMLAMRREEIAKRRDYVADLGVLEAGSERFDLAFAGVAQPEQLEFDFGDEVGSKATRIEPIAALHSSIDMPQINGLQREVPAPATRSGVLRSRARLTAVSEDRSLAIANEAIAEAFSGSLDISGEAVGALEAGSPVPENIARAIATPPSTPALDPQVEASRRAQAEMALKTELGARVNGVMTGRVDFEQRNGTIAIRLGSVVDLLRNRFASAELNRIAGSGALDAFLTLEQLQAAGVPISYSAAYDEVEFGIDYADAPYAGKVQVDQIGVQSVGDERTQMQQISR